MTMAQTDEAQPDEGMGRRSWYMSAETAESMAAAVSDLHHSHKCPKHRVLGALVKVALAHRAEVEALLSAHDAK
jgi:hypothetical protein